MAENRKNILFVLDKTVYLFDPSEPREMDKNSFEIFQKIYETFPQDKYRIFLAHDLFTVREIERQTGNILLIQNNIYTLEHGDKYYLGLLDGTELDSNTLKLFMQERMSAKQIEKNENNEPVVVSTTTLKIDLMVSVREVNLPTLFASRVMGQTIPDDFRPPHSEEITKFEPKNKWGTLVITYEQLTEGVEEQEDILDKITYLVDDALPVENKTLPEQITPHDMQAVMKKRRSAIMDRIRERWTDIQVEET